MDRTITLTEEEVTHLKGVLSDIHVLTENAMRNADEDDYHGMLAELALTEAIQYKIKDL